MIYLIAGAAVLALLVWAGRGGLNRPGGVKLAGGGLSLLLLAAAALVSLRGAWLLGLVFLALALGGAFATRGAVRATPPDLGEDEARSILGVGPNASEAEIREAHSRLMRMAHPDKGGTSGLAAQLNAARDRLLRR